MKHLEDGRDWLLAMQKAYLLVALVGVGAPRHQWSPDKNHNLLGCLRELGVSKSWPKNVPCVPTAIQ